MGNAMKKGFTLIELLVAAALVAVLTVAATRTFRTMKNDVEWENAKHAATVIAAAAYRFRIEYPNATFNTTKLTNPGNWRDSRTCNPKTTVNLQQLVDCNFLEARQYIPKGFTLKFQSASSPNVEVSGSLCCTTVTEGADAFSCKQKTCGS